MFITNWLAVNIPVHIGASIDVLSESIEEDYSELLHHIYIVMGFALCMIVIRTLSRMLFFNPGRDVERELKNDAFSRLTLLQKDFYSQHQVGSLISIVNNDVSGVRAMAGVGAMQVFNIGFALSLTPIKMWQLSPTLTLYCIAPVLTAFIIVNYSIAYMRKLVRVRMQVLQALSSETVNFLNGVDVIKNFHIQSWAVADYEKGNQQLLECSLKQLRVRTFFLPILEYTDGLLKILILAVGGFYLIQQSMSLGELTAFLSYATLLAMPFISLGRIISTFQMGMVSLKSIRRILGTELSDQPLLDSGQQSALFSKGISVKNLSYRYPSSDNDKPALNAVSFDILPGQKVAILGKVGSGKTTLVNCLNHYLDVPAGHIFIDGHDITELSRDDLRTAIRTVTQEPFLFSDTVSNNVQFGSSGHEDVLSIDDALYQSDMLEEVKQFPEGDQTLVGEKGILLSGGQKQRLSLSRAMYTPCKLIVLDNVLSAVDNETERFLLTQIFDVMRSQSSLIVSHRPAVLERVDHILLMEEGTIIAQGSHQHLQASSSVYRDTWHLLQKGGSQDTDLVSENLVSENSDELIQKSTTNEIEGNAKDSSEKSVQQ